MANASEKMKLICGEVADLFGSLDAYLAEKKRQNGRNPTRGDGSEWKTDGYGVSHLVKEGLPQGATPTAIRRKIITIRDHLNELGKLV